MFRALILLMLLGGNPQINIENKAVLSDANLLGVENFQWVEVAQRKPLISAKSAIAIDLDSQMVLFENEPNLQLPIASLAKLMTALVILDENELDQIVTITNEVQNTEGSRIWLYPKESITVENLLTGMLIASGNDAAYELAIYNAGSLIKFAEKMNKMAFYLGLSNSHFEDPAGLDDENNYSSAYDLGLIAKHVLKNPLIRQIARTPETTISSVDGKVTHHLKNTNKLLGGFLDAQGLKTGTTDLAKECLISLLKINNNDVLIIVLGSEDRYKDTKTLYNFLKKQ